MKLIKVISITLLANMLFLLHVQAKSFNEMKDDYMEAGQKIVDMVNSGNVDIPTVETNVLILTKSSVAIAQAYIVKHPEGRALLEEAIRNVATLSGGNVTALGAMKKESFQEIEDRWHDLGYTQEKDYGVDMDDEDNEHFTDPLHTMIHPLMVYVAAKSGDYAAMKTEMEEGMEQIELTVEML